MDYTTKELAELAGVTARTLRYYDQIGLLRPARVRSTGYREYGREEVDRLQQILFYRALGLDLARIHELLAAPGFDKAAALEGHLETLLSRRDQLDRLICNARKTIASMKGETTMTDREKFEGLKQKLIDDNERDYGAELRRAYGEAEVDASNRHIKELTEERYTRAQQLSNEIDVLLLQAMETGDPAGEVAQRACSRHEEWLRAYYPGYSRDYHRSLGDLYVQDDRFRAYYDRIAPGCAAFLRDAIAHYCK